MSSLSRRRKIFLTSTFLLVAGSALLHFAYPLPYIYLVLSLRGPDFSDIHRFPASTIQPAEVPRQLPKSVDSGSATTIARLAHHDSLDGFLDATDTTAFLVLRNGEIITERYLGGHNADSLQNSFSISKSVTSALVGLAVRDGLFAPEVSITELIPELEARDPRFSQITLEHLLDMRSGIRYSSKVSFPFINGDNPLIYFHPDLQAVALERTTIGKPPGEFQYNNYNPPLLGIALNRSLGSSVSEFLQSELWQPLGSEGAAGWTLDDNRFERMESGFHARARDLARFGQLYLDLGQLDDRQILPADWIRKSTDLESRIELDQYDGRTWGYQSGWWIVPRSSGRSDFCAIGHFGQFVYISPQHQMVFVRTGPGRGSWGDRDWTALFFAAAAQLGPSQNAGTSESASVMQYNSSRGRSTDA